MKRKTEQINIIRELRRTTNKTYKEIAELTAKKLNTKPLTRQRIHTICTSPNYGQPIIKSFPHP